MKKEPRLLHVSCVVREDGEVWALLRALEACAVANVEVKPVGGDIPPRIAAAMGITVHAEQEEQERLPPPPPSLNAVLRLTPPKQKRASHSRGPEGNTKRGVLAVLQHHVPMAVARIIVQTGFRPSMVYSALHEMTRMGWVKRQSPGVYVRGAVPAGLMS